VDTVEDVDDWPIERRRGVDSSVIRPIFGAYHTLHDRLRREMADAGLDATAGVVLSTVNREPMCSPVVLRRRLGFRRSTLTSILDRLTDRGLITRAVGISDRRTFIVTPTVKGRTVAQRVHRRLTELERAVGRTVSAADLRGFLKVIAAVEHQAHNLTASRASSTTGRTRRRSRA